MKKLIVVGLMSIVAMLMALAFAYAFVMYGVKAGLPLAVALVLVSAALIIWASKLTDKLEEGVWTTSERHLYEASVFECLRFLDELNDKKDYGLVKRLHKEVFGD